MKRFLVVILVILVFPMSARASEARIGELREFQDTLSYNLNKIDDSYNSFWDDYKIAVFGEDIFLDSYTFVAGEYRTFASFIYGEDKIVKRVEFSFELSVGNHIDETIAALCYTIEPSLNKYDFSILFDRAYGIMISAATGNEAEFNQGGFTFSAQKDDTSSDPKLVRFSISVV